MDEDGNVSTVLTSLVEALEDDPFYVAITRDFSCDRARRREVLAAYFDYSMRAGRAIGRCTVLPGDHRGAAIWTMPQTPGRMAESKREKHRFLERTLGREGLADYDLIIGFMSARTEKAVGHDAWYLSILGVSPEAQGKGIGRMLLRPTLDEADRAGADCYLETYSDRSASFYRRLGFEQVASHTEPVTSSEYWIMVRKPG
jgi:ribosomal protein S18 acetylase RimI-like enzyme